jgi:hypothetical protein
MISKSAKRPEYTPATHDTIVQALVESPEPIPAAQLTRIPGLSQKVVATHLPQLLAEDLASGRLFYWGGKAKLYWHRDPKSVAHERIMQALSDAAQPIAAGALLKLPGVVLKAADLTKLLADDIAAGRLSYWGTKDKLYWSRNLQSVARDRLLELAARENLSKEELNSLAAAQSPKIEAPKIKAACEALIKEKHLVLKPAAMQTRPVATQTVNEVADKILDAMNRIAFAPGTTVTFYRLRQQPELAHLPKTLFDQAALLLQQERRALLTFHGHAASLPDAERDELVTDGLGTYYASIYSR